MDNPKRLQQNRRLLREIKLNKLKRDEEPGAKYEKNWDYHVVDGLSDHYPPSKNEPVVARPRLVNLWKRLIHLFIRNII